MKPIYSYSQVEKGQCARKFQYEYREKAPRETTYNLVAGSLLDCAFNAYYEGNLHLSETHEQRMAYARARVDVELDEHPAWKTMPWSKKAGDPRSSWENYLWWLFEGSPPAASLVCRPDRGPVSVQMKLLLELPRYKIVGYVDCFEESVNTVVDIKMVTGWSATTEAQYALRSQVPLYRMMMQDIFGKASSGRYELLLARKKPKLVVVYDNDIDFIQARLIEQFEAHHRMVTTGCDTRNPEKCFEYNRVCQHFGKCWPEIPVAESKQ